MIKDINHRFTIDVQNVDKRQPERTKITEKIIARQQIRTRQDIADWKHALISAESIETPNRRELIRIYDNVILDGHITGIIKAITNKIKAKEFMIVDSNGKEDEDSTKLFEKKWFFKFLELTIEAPFWGFSLVQLGDIKDDGFPDLELVPRDHVIPEFQIVKKDAFNTSKENGFKYLEQPLEPWFIFIGEEKELGWLNKATPHALAKMNLFSEMWEFAELFGMPTRIGRTDIKDDVRRKQMETMMDRMGSGGWAVFDKDDLLELVESGKGDPAKAFIAPIKLSNEEISKAFAGQVGVFDEKSFVGSAEVQERLFNEFILSFSRQTKFVINDDLIPRMVLHRILPPGFTFRWKAEQILTTKEKATIIKELSQFYTYSPETVTKETGIKVEDVPQKVPGPQSIMNDVRNLYKHFV